MDSEAGATGRSDVTQYTILFCPRHEGTKKLHT